MQVFRLGVTVILACLIGAGVAFADQHQAREVCKADVEKFCKDVQRGDGRVAKCLADHQADLSASCKEGMAKAQERIKHVTQACHSDMQTLCKGIEAGGGRIARCLKENDAKLSGGCRSAIHEKG